MSATNSSENLVSVTRPRPLEAADLPCYVLLRQAIDSLEYTALTYHALGVSTKDRETRAAAIRRIVLTATQEMRRVSHLDQGECGNGMVKCGGACCPAGMASFSDAGSPCA